MSISANKNTFFIIILKILQKRRAINMLLHAYATYVRKKNYSHLALIDIIRLFVLVPKARTFLIFMVY